MKLTSKQTGNIIS